MSINPIRSDTPINPDPGRKKAGRFGFPALVVGLFVASFLGILVASFASVLWESDRARDRELEQIHDLNQTIGNLIYRGRLQKLEQILLAVSRGSSLLHTLESEGNGRVSASLDAFFSNNHEGVLDFLMLLDAETGKLHKVATGAYSFDLLDGSIKTGAIPIEQPFLMSIPGGETPTVLLVISQHLVDERTGRLIATIIGGTILTDNHSLVREIKQQSQAYSVGLYFAGTLIAQTTGYDGTRPTGETGISVDFTGSVEPDSGTREDILQERLILSYPLSVGFGATDDLIVQSINPPGAFIVLKEEFESDFFLSFGIVLAISVLLSVALYRFTQRSLRDVSRYARSVASGEVASYNPSSILEFNELGKSVGELYTAWQDSKELSQQVLNKTPSVVLIKDLEGRYLFVNRACENLFDIRMEEVIGRTIFNVQSKDVAEAVTRNEKIALDQDKPVEFEEIIPTPKGARVFLSVKFPLRNTNGELVAVCGISTDISERKRVERRLQEAKEEADLANRAKTEFLANMSHELRTPLNAIIGFSDIMGSELFGKINPSRYQEYSLEIQKSGEHLLRLISDILDVSKIEIGEAQLEEAACDLEEIAKSSVILLRDRAFAGGVTIQNEISPDLPDIWGDRRRLSQVLINLLSNAVKFTKPGGTVTLKAALDGEGSLVLSVVDSGIGMDEQTLANIFEPFVQGDDTMSKRFEGTGLGLTLVRKLLEQHGGSITLSSEKNVGTTATVLLPAYRVIGAKTALPQS